MTTKKQLLELAERIAESAGVKMAVGGGVAVCAHGYRRETADVDAFFHYEDQRKILKAVNQLLGDDFILEELDPSHWTLTGVGSPPDERIDLLFATGNPEESAVEMAVLKVYQGVRVPVFPVDLLVISKFLAERDDAKDSLDIYELIRRGAVEVYNVLLRLKQMGLEEDATRFVGFVEYLQQLSARKKR
jgi:hypothetical protein